MSTAALSVYVQRLHELPELVKQEATQVLLRDAELMAGLAQIYVHVNRGNLRDSIHVEQQGESVAVVAGGPQAPYAGYLEAKFPFMAPAAAQVEPQLRADLQLIQRRIDEHFSK